jgi:hypothetical protein
LDLGSLILIPDTVFDIFERLETLVYVTDISQRILLVLLELFAFFYVTHNISNKDPFVTYGLFSLILLLVLPSLFKGVKDPFHLVIKAVYYEFSSI